MKVIDAHGADALRLYLINSPVVRAESLKFKEEGVQATVREVLLPWFNAFRFFVQQARRLEMTCAERFVPNPEAAAASTNVMDAWIQAALQGLVKVRQERRASREVKKHRGKNETCLYFLCRGDGRRMVYI